MPSGRSLLAIYRDVGEIDGLLESFDVTLSIGLAFSQEVLEQNFILRK